MEKGKLKELLFSLGWASWSCHHNENSKRLIAELCPDADAEAELRIFTDIVISQPGHGSPK